MKAFMISFFLALLMSISLASYSQKILLTGKPVILIPEDTYYAFPKNYTALTNYHFVDISGDQRVCFINNQPELEALDLLRIYIILNGKRFFWYCYRYSPAFFQINY